MLDFVLKDVNPQIIGGIDLFLKEMNNTVVLLTVASGPFVSASLFDVPDSGPVEYRSKENDFEAYYKGSFSDGKQNKGYFELTSKGKKMFVASFTLNEDAASDMRVQINAEGESLARKELETAFERDFSQEAHEYIKSPLEALRRKIERDKIPETSAAPDLANPADEEVTETATESTEEEVTETPTELTEADSTNDPETSEVLNEGETSPLEVTSKTQELIDDIESLIVKLNDLCHDLTRGAAGNFSDNEVKEETLENGAKIHMLDGVHSDYKVTLRKGVLNDLTEVSFFLENTEGLVFSLYLSSEGKGNTTASGPNTHIVFKKVQDYLT